MRKRPGAGRPVGRVVMPVNRQGEYKSHRGILWGVTLRRSAQARTEEIRSESTGFRDGSSFEEHTKPAWGFPISAKRPEDAASVTRLAIFPSPGV